MSRLSIRPRPLDIHKKLPVLKSFKDFDDDETATTTVRNYQLHRLAAAENEIDDDDYMGSDDTASGHQFPGPTFVHPKYTDSNIVVVHTSRMKRELKRPASNGWIRKRDPDKPMLLFTRPLDPEQLAAVGIMQPPCPPAKNGSNAPTYRFHGRIGRGGRIIFDWCNPLLRAPIGHETFPGATHPRPYPSDG